MMAAGSHIGFDLDNIRPPIAIVGLKLVPKFGLDQIHCFGDIVIFIFCRFGLKLPIHAHFFFGGGRFGSIFPPDYVTHHSNPQKALPYAETRRLSHKAENRFSGSAWARSREKKDRTGQDRTVKKKSQSGNISPICGKAPTVPIRTKICMVGSLPDIITYAKFQVEIFRGYDFTGG